MFFRGKDRTTGATTLTNDSASRARRGIGSSIAFGAACFWGALCSSSALAGVITFDDFSAAKASVMIRANPIDASSTATTVGGSSDYWSSRTFRIVTTTGGDNRTNGFIDKGRLEIANSDGIESRAGISWTSRNIPSGITAWTLTAELLTLDTGTVSTAASSVTRLNGAAFSSTLVTLGTGTALAAINQEFFIDSGPSSDFTMDNVKLNYTCRTVNDTTAGGIGAAVAAAAGAAGDGCQVGSVPVPSTLLLLCLSGLLAVFPACRRALQDSQNQIV